MVLVTPADYHHLRISARNETEASAFGTKSQAHHETGWGLDDPTEYGSEIMP